MKVFYLNIGLVLLIGISQISFAKLVTWTDNIPSALKPFDNNAQQIAAIAQDNILIYAHPATKTSLPTFSKQPQPIAKFSTAAIVVPVSSQEVAKTLSNYTQYVGLFPTLKSAKVIETAGPVSQLKYRISIPTPIPVLNFNEDVVMQHQIGQNSISTMVIDGPIPYALGKFEWFNLADNKTLVTLTQWGDLNQPQGFLFKKILNAFPEVKLAIPNGSSAFVLEALKNKYTTKKVTALNAGQLPSPQLNTAQINKIVQVSANAQQPVSIVLNPVTVPYTHGREVLRFTTSYQYLNATPQQLQRWTQPLSYKEIFPKQIKSIKTTAINTQGQDADFKVSVGLGVISIPFDFKMRFSYPKATENNFYANGGDLRYLKGQIQFLPQGNNTLLKMTTTIKIDEKAPFLLKAARSLPYHEMLPALGANAIFAQKVK
ncbi:SRPBCC family protein [Acinetobacter guillouiae]|uniref:SRPBCC family protein n=1 Tax=Acinetobacter TaxID=469 RepID=UPI001FBA34E9|nr:SRPBCC family protein [Acinetobacter sp. NyZ410]UOH18150.1 SRPBCC family protein [Acinetobacter sp. NyZ410]